MQVDLMAGVRTLDIARRDADLAVRFARPTAPELVCRKLGEVGYSLYASRRYLAKCASPKRGAGLAGYDLITFTGAPAATSPFFMGENLEGARVAVRCDSPLIQLQAAAQDVGIVELAFGPGQLQLQLLELFVLDVELLLLLLIERHETSGEQKYHESAEPRDAAECHVPSG